MRVSYIDDLGNAISETVDTYKDIFVDSDNKVLFSNEPLLLLFGKGDSHWLVQNDDYEIYATGTTLKEAFQNFDDLLIHAYYHFRYKVSEIPDFKRVTELKELYISTFSV